jgi:hypothetical protein
VNNLLYQNLHIQSNHLKNNIIGFEMIGILLAIIIQGPFASTGDCKKLNESMNENLYENLTNTQLGVWESNKYAFIALVLGIIFFIALTLLVVFVTERKGELSLNFIMSYFPDILSSLLKIYYIPYQVPLKKT